MPRMTEAEFAQQQDALLNLLPVEFRGVVSYKAWEDGHSSGYEEVLYHVNELVEMLAPCIQRYTERLNEGRA